MIIGLGIDIVENKRIANVLEKYGNRFIKRCFSINEIIQSKKQLNQINFFSKRYAAKEACAKALGTGLAKGVFWKDIEIKNNNFGKPQIKLHNKALDRFRVISSSLKTSIEISITDEKNYSAANVIIFKNEK
jgi:holo-[acyl-carrier protein] synthase